MDSLIRKSDRLTDAEREELMMFLNETDLPFESLRETIREAKNYSGMEYEPTKEEISIVIANLKKLMSKTKQLIKEVWNCLLFFTVDI